MNETKTVATNAEPEAYNPTVGEHLDRQIANTRQRLEELCIAKAKAETVQILNVPMSFIHTIGW